MYNHVILPNKQVEENGLIASYLLNYLKQLTSKSNTGHFTPSGLPVNQTIDLLNLSAQIGVERLQIIEALLHLRKTGLLSFYLTNFSTTLVYETKQLLVEAT